MGVFPNPPVLARRSMAPIWMTVITPGQGSGKLKSFFTTSDLTSLGFLFPNEILSPFGVVQLGLVGMSPMMTVVVVVAARWRLVATMKTALLSLQET
jgi:hypothetical protein